MFPLPPIWNYHSAIGNQERTTMNTSTSARCTSLFLFSLILFATGLASAEGTVPDGINYQGLLTDAKGDPVKPDGTYTLEFRLWSDPDAEDTSTSALVWGRSFTVTVVSGQFNVILNDDGTALAEDAEHRVKSLMDAFAEPKRYLGIKINNAPVTPQEGKTEAAEKATTITGEIKPRQAILSAPYAIQAENGVPVGTIVSYYGTTEPTGWLFCNGQSLPGDRPEYAALRALIGNSVPDLGGEFLRGLALGQTLGERQICNTARPKNPTFEVRPDGAHTHSMTTIPCVNTGGQISTVWTNRPLSQPGQNTDNISIGTNPAHSHVIDNWDDETRPQNVALPFIIKY